MTSAYRELAGRRWVAVMGPFQYPWGQAASRRIHGVALTVLSTGRDVVVCSTGREAQPPARLRTLGDASLYHVQVDEEPSASTSVARAGEWLLGLGGQATNWLQTATALAGPPSHVIVYGGAASYMTRLRKWCAVHNAALLIDMVEWYDSASMRGGRLGPQAMMDRVSRVLQRRADGAIVISRYLEDYYRIRVPYVLRVPPTVDLEETRPCALRSSDQSKVRLVYAGSPGEKDLLAPLVHAISRVDPDGLRFVLDLVGPDERQLISITGTEPQPRSIRILGRQSQPDTIELVRQADFSVLLRPDRRSSHAGFPSKVVESLSVGTPVIANLTGDLGDFLKHDVNGYVLSDVKTTTLEARLRLVSRLDVDALLRLRTGAVVTADDFDYRAYSHRMDRFLEACRLPQQSRLGATTQP